MLISDYLKIRSQQANVTAAEKIHELENPISTEKNASLIENNINQLSFAEALNKQLETRRGVDFSTHALKRIESRNINMDGSDKLERLNRGVEIAAEKGSNETLVLIDSTAFVVSVKNNKVITTMSSEDLKGSIFTNIDSTVII